MWGRAGVFLTVIFDLWNAHFCLVRDQFINLKYFLETIYRKQHIQKLTSNLLSDTSDNFYDLLEFFFLNDRPPSQPWKGFYWFYFLFKKDVLYLYIKKKKSYRESWRNRVRSSICWISPQMTTMTRAAPGRSQKPRASSWSATQVQGPKHLGHSSLLSQAH